MNASNLAADKHNFIEEIKIRGMMVIFMFLVFRLNSILAQLISQPGTNGPLQLLIYSLLDLVSVIFLSLLFKNKRISRDLNELNFYSMLIHLIYIPFYFYGVRAIYHNTAINILLVAVAIRLVYFGKRTSDGDYQGLPVFGLLGLLRMWYSAGSMTLKIKFAHLPSILFFGCAAPLWFIAYTSNDLQVALTVAGLMVFVFFIANQIHKHHVQSENNPIAASPDASLLKELASLQTYKYFTTAFGIALVLVIAFSMVMVHMKESTFFDRGYQEGYTDGKDGKKPISAEHKEKLLSCYRYDPNTIAASPRDPDCMKIDRSTWQQP